MDISEFIIKFNNLSEEERKTGLYNHPNGKPASKSLNDIFYQLRRIDVLIKRNTKKKDEILKLGEEIFKKLPKKNDTK